MNDPVVLESFQNGDIVTQLCHNSFGERYFVRQWDIHHDEQTSDTPFSYQDVDGQTKKEALDSATAKYRRFRSP